MPPSARKTTRLLSQLQQDGVARGGNPGARRALAEGKPVSARTLLRLVRALPLPPVGDLPVVGIDDWAKRRGRSYDAPHDLATSGLQCRARRVRARRETRCGSRCSRPRPA